jgi:anti-sigma-K factor RsiG
VELLPDLASLTDADLKKMIQELQEEEREISYQRRLLHGKIDILRAEYQARLKAAGPETILSQVDVEHLTAILAGKASPQE